MLFAWFVFLLAIAQLEIRNHTDETISFFSTFLTQLQQALDQERNDNNKNFKLLLQEKEEQLIGMQMDNEKLKDEFLKLKYDKDRCENDVSNIRREADEAHLANRTLNEKLRLCEQNERDAKRLMQSNEKRLEEALALEKSDYTRVLIFIYFLHNRT